MVQRRSQVRVRRPGRGRQGLRCILSVESDRRAVLRVRGEVYIATAEQFRAAALALVRQGRKAVFDVEDAMLLDASGLRVLAAVSREAQPLGYPKPVLRGVRPLLAKSLRATGLLDSFGREPTVPLTLVISWGADHSSGRRGVPDAAAAS